MIDAVNTPNATIRYSASNRRLSAAQIEAGYRRLLEGERREEAQRHVDDLEADLAETLSCWREMPTIPDGDAYTRALEPQPFSFSESPPKAPNLEEAEDRARLATRDAVVAENPMPSARLAAPIAVGAVVAAVGAATTAYFQNAYGLAAGAILGVVLGASLVDRSKNAWKEALEPSVVERSAAAWATERARLQDNHRAATTAWEERRNNAEHAHVARENDRVAFARQLVAGDEDAISRTVSDSLMDIDFPFQADAQFATNGPDHASLLLDLPEIEDVIPETTYRVLKSGALKPVKRKVNERNYEYACLAAGLSVMVARVAFSAAPTLRTIEVAAYTQRAQRKTKETGDDFVVVASFNREAVAGFQESSGDPLEFLSKEDGTIELTATRALKKLPAPAWVEDFSSSAMETTNYD